MTRAEFQLETLTCPSCIKKIEATMNKTEGVESVKVLFNSSKVKVEFNDVKTSADKLQDTIIKLGYPVLSSKVS